MYPRLLNINMQFGKSSFGKLRQISSNAKVDAVVALSNSILISESSIVSQVISSILCEYKSLTNKCNNWNALSLTQVIFTNYVAVAKDIYQKLEGLEWDGELLTGETAPRKRQAMVDNFQVSQRENEM